MPTKICNPDRVVGSRLVRAAFSAFIGTIGCLAPATSYGAPDDCPFPLFIPGSHPPRRDTGNHPDCGTHNAMMVGEQNVFVSHLPMFGIEHRFQVILEVELAKEGESRNGVYAKDRREHPTARMYTLEPSEIFVLATLFSGDDNARRISFPGTIFRGHLERGGTPIDQLTAVDVNVKRVVYAQEIGPPRGPDREGKLTYILFGRGAEMFLAHWITQPPDFDQLLSVNVSGHDFTEDELNRGVLVTVPDRANEPAHRLRQGEAAAVNGHVAGAHAFLQLKVGVVAERYFEEGELATEATFDPTPLEIEAGFGHKP